MKGHRKRCGCRAMSNRLLRPNALYNGGSSGLVDIKMKKK